MDSLGTSSWPVSWDLPRLAASLRSPVTRPGQPALWEGHAVPATPPPAWLSRIGNWEQMCALTLEIPKSGQDNTEAYSKVGGTGTYGDVWGRRQPGENISPDTALWGGQGPGRLFHHCSSWPKGKHWVTGI